MHTISRPRRPIDFDTFRSQQAPSPRWYECCQPTDIEDLLIWTYRDQRAAEVSTGDRGLFAQEAFADGFQRPATSGCGVAAMSSIGELGTRVSTSRASAGVLHNDADRAHAAVMLLGEATARLMIWHGRRASRPDDEEIPISRPFPVKNERGRIVREYAPWDKSKNYGWTPIKWTAPPVSAEMISRDYSTWRGALGVLAYALSTDRSLTSHRVGPTPRAPAAPKLRYRSRASARLRSPSPSLELATV